MKIIRFLLLIIVIGLTILFFMRDGIIKSVATKYGTQSLNTPLEIASIETNIGDKTLSAKLIEVNNLAGFEAKDILKIERINLDLGDDINTENIVVDNFSVNNTVINLEQNASGINIKLLADKLRSSNTNGGTNTVENKDNSVINFDIKTISITGTKIIANTQIFKDELVIPDIKLENIKANSKNIAQVLVGILLDEAEKALKRKGLDVVKDKLEETLTRKIGDKLGFDGGSLNETKEQAKDKIEEVKDNLGDKFKNLLKF